MKINPIIKGSIGVFYNSIFLDKFPYRRITALDMNCFEYDNIVKASTPLDGYPINWINKKPNINEKNILNIKNCMSNIKDEAFIELP